MATLPVARVILFARDAARLASFHADTLGLPKVETVDDPAEFLTFDAGSLQLCLHRVPEPWASRMEIADPPQPRRGTPLKVAFHTPDVHRARAELEARGARMGPVQGSGERDLCDGIDPEGNVFQLTNRP